MEQKPGDRPKRIKGVHRAAKRGQKWASELLKVKGTFSGLLAWMWYRIDFAGEWSKRDSFYKKMNEHDDGWFGGTLPWPKSTDSVRKRGWFRAQAKK